MERLYPSQSGMAAPCAKAYGSATPALETDVRAFFAELPWRSEKDARTVPRATSNGGRFREADGSLVSAITTSLTVSVRLESCISMAAVSRVQPELVVLLLCIFCECCYADSVSFADPLAL